MLQYGPPIISEFQLDCDMDRDPERCRSAILDQLSHVHKNVHRVELDFSQRQIESEYITTLLGSSHSANVKWLKIYGGTFSDYNPTPQDMQYTSHNITKLKLKYTTIASQRVLPMLSKDFPYLEHIKFRSCEFESSKNTINIFMEGTVVGTLEIKHSSYEDVLAGSLVLLSVDLQDQNITKYYMQATSKPPVAICDNEEGSEESEDSDGIEEVSDDSDTDMMNEFMIIAR